MSTQFNWGNYLRSASSGRNLEDGKTPEHKTTEQETKLPPGYVCLKKPKPPTTNKRIIYQPKTDDNDNDEDDEFWIPRGPGYLETHQQCSLNSFSNKAVKAKEKETWVDENKHILDELYDVVSEITEREEFENFVACHSSSFKREF